MNIADWTKELEELYAGQKSGKIKPPQAVEMNNTVGKVIGIVKLQLEYCKLTSQPGSKIKIQALEARSK